ncbi:hypothetical protein J2Y37_001277 [Prolinoborus sp. 3657]|nr:hypothetical protein [Prolinoborus sp. 3657]
MKFEHFSQAPSKSFFDQEEGASYEFNDWLGFVGVSALKGVGLGEKRNKFIKLSSMMVNIAI